jgi:hypothetical protein
MHLVALIAFAAGAGATAPESGFAGDLVATWSYADAERDLAVSVDANGLCAVSGRAKAAGRAFRLECGYWLVGSRLHLRIERDPSGARPVLELEYIREGDQLVIPGETPIVLTRQPLDHREE